MGQFKNLLKYVDVVGILGKLPGKGFSKSWLVLTSVELSVSRHW